MRKRESERDFETLIYEDKVRKTVRKRECGEIKIENKM